ncbi:MAG: Uma2 family endonuclease [Desulfococcaceae bacterium]
MTANTALAEKTVFTKEEYLEMEAQALEKSEYYSGEIFAMAGGSRNHSIICINLAWALREAVNRKECTAFDSSMKVDIKEPDAYVYPDLSVVCGDIEFPENSTDIICNPVLVMEVLSPGTESFDRGKKFCYYRSIPSLREYVLISQSEPLIERYFMENKGRWIYAVSNGLEDVLALQSLDSNIFLKDIYQKVVFEKQFTGLHK